MQQNTLKSLKQIPSLVVATIQLDLGSRKRKRKKNRPTKAGEINFDAIGSCKERLILIPKLISKLVECCFFHFLAQYGWFQNVSLGGKTLTSLSSSSRGRKKLEPGTRWHRAPFSPSVHNLPRLSLVKVSYVYYFLNLPYLCTAPFPSNNFPFLFPFHFHISAQPF